MIKIFVLEIYFVTILWMAIFERERSVPDFSNSPPLKRSARIVGNGGSNMGIKRHIPEEIVRKLRQVEVLCGQGMRRVDAIRQVQITKQKDYRWRK